MALNIKDFLGKKLGGFISPYLTMRGSDTDMYDLTKTVKSKDYLLTEKYVWFLGDTEILADFYQYNTNESNVINVRDEYFYSNASQGIRAVHSGLPNLISETKGRLLFSGGTEITTEKVANQETLDSILEENEIEKLNKKAVAIESWSSKVAYKLCFDKEVSNYPIIQLYDAKNFEEVKTMGRTQEIDFKEIIKDGKDKYLYLERYGFGYIKYELYLIKKGHKEEQFLPVSLDSLEQTKGLEDIMFPKDNIILAKVKDGCKSDYDGIISEFDAYDEAWSSFAEEIRNGKALTYIPENKIRYVDGKASGYDQFKKRFIKMASDITEDGSNKIEFDQPAIRSQAYENALAVLRNNILNSVGLSAVTIGIDDGANVSGLSRREKEKASLRTREEMINSWKPFLESLYELLLQANDIFNGKSKKEYNVIVNFGEYITLTFDEKVISIVPLYQNGVIDNEKALDELYELSDEEKARILANTGNISFNEEEI